MEISTVIMPPRSVLGGGIKTALIFIISPPLLYYQPSYTIMWLLHPSPWAKGNYASFMPHYATPRVASCLQRDAVDIPLGHNMSSGAA